MEWENKHANSPKTIGRGKQRTQKKEKKRPNSGESSKLTLYNQTPEEWTPPST
jgi:hypothetical protein